MRFLIGPILSLVFLCVASAFVGAYYSHRAHKIEVQDIRREMDDKVQLLGEQTELLHGKLKRCLDAKYLCCK